jgi:hypothetical protein
LQFSLLAASPETFGYTLVYNTERLLVFENKVLRRIIRPKREEVARGWRRLYKEKLHNCYSSPNIVKIIEG